MIGLMCQSISLVLDSTNFSRLVAKWLKTWPCNINTTSEARTLRRWEKGGSQRD